MQRPIKWKPGIVEVISLLETFVFLEPAVRKPYFGPSSNLLLHVSTFSPPMTRMLKPENPLTVKPEMETPLTGFCTAFTRLCSLMKSERSRPLPATHIPAWLGLVSAGGLIGPAKLVHSFSTAGSGGVKVTPLPTREMPSVLIKSCSA